MLRVMLDELQPDGVVFSGWGLREGLLFQRLGPDARRKDPLLAGVSEFAEPRGGPAALAELMAAWTSAAARSEDEGGERLRLAATQLALAATHVEPNLRSRHAYEWAMDKRWVGLDPAGRARLAAALLAASGKVAPPAELERLASWEQLREAICWGLAIRLARRLAAGSGASLRASSLMRDGDSLVLALSPARAHLVSDKVLNELKNLAQWLALEPETRVLNGKKAEPAPRPNLTRV
jgi:exopolyphosphatase/guanosine-5'-triphosphate,3'-diphosphate pyrophosphatase